MVDSALNLEKISTKQALLKAATKMFSSQSYDAVSVAGLCREAGVANGTFYLYFQNKEEVFSALVEDISHELAAMLRAPERANLTAVKKVVFDVEVVVSFFEQKYDIFKIIMCDHGLGRQDHDSLIDLFALQRADELQEGLARGEYPPDLNPFATAYAETAIINEFMMLWARKPSAFTRPGIIAELIRLRMRLLFQPSAV